MHYQPLKRQSVFKLKVIAAVEQKTMMEVFDELVNNKWETIDVKTRGDSICKMVGVNVG